jgi:hypothetical protein
MMARMRFFTDAACAQDLARPDWARRPSPGMCVSRMVVLQMQRTKTGAHEMTTFRSYVDARSSVADETRTSDSNSAPRVRELLRAVRLLARDQPLLETRIAELSSELRILGHA